MLSTADSARERSANETGDDVRADRAALWLWAIVIASIVLRLMALAYKSFWIDEIASVAIARRASHVFWHFLWHDEGNMAAYYVLLRPWLYFGYGEGTVRLLRSNFPGPVNIGSQEMVTINKLVDLVADIAGKRIGKKHIPGPLGVRGRNSDNRLIKEKLGWAPSQPLRSGLEPTYRWIATQVLRNSA